MLMSPTTSLSDAAPSGSATFLVGDAGGTNCRLALAQCVDGQVHLNNVQRYKCSAFPSAEDAIDSYLKSMGWDAPLGAAVIAIAGPISGGEVQSTNMHWRMSEAGLRGHGAQNVKLINDYTALALSVEHLSEDDIAHIGPKVSGDSQDTIAVIGAGTGFGAGALTRGVGGAVAIATEGGHVSFAPVDEVEVHILKVLTRRFGRVSIERLLSGPGLVNLRQALSEIEGRPLDDIASEDIVREAEAGDELSQLALDRFCAIYGSVAGDVTLMYGARGGVFLGGGIAPAIARHLQAGTFRRRFEDKGRFRDYMAAIPTRIIMNTYAALLGSAFLASTIAGQTPS
jgi:glucokinase